MSYIVLLFYCFQILSVKLNEIESLRNYLHVKEKSVDLSSLNTKKVTASMIHAERAFASAKMEGMLKRHKEAMGREHNVNKTIITLKDSQLAKKDGEINKLKTRVTKVQRQHKALLDKHYASLIHTEHALASAKMHEREHNANKTIITLKDSHLAKKDGEINKLKARVTQVQTKHKAKLLKQADIINYKQDSINEQTRIHEKNIGEMDDWMAEVNEERESAVSLFIKSEEKLLASKKAANALKMKLNRTETKLIEYQRSGSNLQRRCEQLECSLVELDMEKSECIAELEHDCAQAIEEFNVSLLYMARFITHSIISNLCHYQLFNRN